MPAGFASTINVGISRAEKVMMASVQALRVVVTVEDVPGCPKTYVCRFENTYSGKSKRLSNKQSRYSSTR